MTNATAAISAKKYLKTVLVIAALVLVASALFGITYLVRVSNYQSTVRNLVIENPSLEGVADGTYVGAFDADIVGARVAVTVKDGRIGEIDLLEHKTEKGQPAEVLTDAIVKEQRVDIDAVSGATNSSKVIQKAVENALTQS